MSDRLERAYRRLLWIYPPGSRREELLDTLLECAGPDRRRPTASETLNLARHGLRAQLGRPAGTAVVVFAVLVAFAFAFFGTVSANWLGWRAVPSLPTGAVSDQLKQTVFPGLTVWGGGDAEKFIREGDGEGVRSGYAVYFVRNTDETRRVRAYAEAARDRLVADGWQIRDDVHFGGAWAEDGAVVRDDQGDWSFWATKDNLALDFTASFDPDRPWYDADGFASFDLSHTEPPWLWALTALGALLGALAGWLCAGWVSRRTEAHSGATALAALLTPAILLFLLPVMLLALEPAILRIWWPEQHTVTPLWNGFTYLGVEFARIAGGLALLVLVVAGWPRGPWSFRLPRVMRRRRGPTLIAFVLVVACMATAGLYRSAAPAWAGPVTCTPTVPPPVTGTHLSRVARIFVSIESTPDQLNLISVAARRAMAGATSFYRDSLMPEFRRTYCGDARLPQAVGRTLPWFFRAELASPGVFPALVAEVGRMPGVVAVQLAPRDTPY